MTINDKNELINKLRHIEVILQNQKTDTEKLKEVVSELKAVVSDLDKNAAIQSEKQSHLYYRVEQLQKQIESLEASGEKTDDRQRDLIEKALMLFIGGLISYLFSLAQGGGN